MRFLNPHGEKVSHTFGKYSLSVEPGETSEDVPDQFAPFVALVGSKLVPAQDKPAPKAKAEAKPKPEPKAAPAATPTA